MEAAEIWQAVGQVLSGLVLGLGLFLWQKFSELKKNRWRLRSSLNSNLKIKDLLIEIRTYYDADRVKLFQFHNGDHYVSGESILKVSLTHFVLGRGVGIPVGAETDLQSIPVAYMDRCLDGVLTADYSLAEVKNLPMESYLAGIFRRNGTEQVLLRILLNRRKEPIGFMVISWLDKLHITKEQLGMCREFSLALSHELLPRN